MFVLKNISLHMKMQGKKKHFWHAVNAKATGGDITLII